MDESTTAETTAPPPAPAAPPRTSIGDHIEFADVGLTVTSASVVPSIKTKDGDAITPGSGEDLVLLETTFTELNKHGTDLSCGSPWGAYIQMWDDQGYEMQPVFETYRIPGNPECNTWLLTGQSHAWNTAWRVVEGNTPYALTIIDTDNYTDYDVIYLTENGPEITLD